jgi:Fe-Mn family superoxide dismutase
MDEHAYHLDFGAKADAWVDAFMRNVHWEGVSDRYRLAVTAASEPFGVCRADLPAAAILDVRRAAAYEQDGQLIPGATWADPAAVGQWAAALPQDREVVVYCVYGHEVGRATALRLRAQGLQAWFLRGGIDGWKAAGMPLEDKRPA